MDPDGLNNLSFKIIESAIAVHSELGPGLLESTYRAGMLHELQLARLSVASELQVPILYKGVLLDGGYRIDLLVENEVIVELKSVSRTFALKTNGLDCLSTSMFRGLLLA